MPEVAKGKFRSRCREGPLLSDTWAPCSVPELGATLCPRTERHPSALSKILPGKTVICLLLAPFRKHPRVPLTQNGVPGRRSGRGEYCHLSHVLELLSF